MLKNRIFKILLNLAIIGTLTSSCVVYKNNSRFKDGISSNAEIKNKFIDFSVGETVVLKTREGERKTGRIAEINDEHFVLWDRTSFIKNHPVESEKDVEAMLTSTGIRENAPITVTYKNGDLLRGRLIGFTPKSLSLTAYNSVHKGLLDYELNYTELSNLRFSEGTMNSIEYASLERIRYDSDLMETIIYNVGGSILVFGFYFAISFGHCPEGPDECL